ncbi:MAG: 6-phosphofructokinase [Ruminococcaceae bacterium]|nr:6-phosphofructokinase [Oscillospiraceae bacterium]
MSKSNIKKIVVLTSGGDAPGMNAAIRAVVRTAIDNGIKVVGAVRGYNGLLNGDVKELSLRDVSGIIHRGGTVLYTARSTRFMQKEGILEAAKYCKKNGIDAVVVIGGDGSFRGALDLSEVSKEIIKEGIPCIGIPGTIDNDISSSDYTIGFDTAMNTAMHMVDNIRDTSQSHDRCSIVEVMGRHAGYIALHTGIACGASMILVPEVEYKKDENGESYVDYQDILKRCLDCIQETRKTGKQHFIIVVAEGVAEKIEGGVTQMAIDIENATKAWPDHKNGMSAKVETRASILGYVQRGGSPTVRDRIIATEMGNHAVELLLEGKRNRVVVMKDDKIIDYDINEALAMKKEFPQDLYEIAITVSK